MLQRLGDKAILGQILREYFLLIRHIKLVVEYFKTYKGHTKLNTANQLVQVCFELKLEYTV